MIAWILCGVLYFAGMVMTSGYLLSEEKRTGEARDAILQILAIIIWPFVGILSAVVVIARIWVR